MRSKLLSVILLLALAFSALTPAAPAQAKAADPASSKGVSPEGMLNPDGTLKLDEGFSGALDLSGYSVSLDSARGPIFGPASLGKNSPAASVTTGNWAAFGDGGGVIDGAVRAIAVIGTNVYVGGDFTDAANDPTIDYIAMWDGTAWSALERNGSDGALNSSVLALAVSGTDLYVGGDFSQVYNSGVLVSGAVYIAKWNGSAWSALGSNGAGGGSLSNPVTELAVSGTDVYAGGNFTNVNNGGTVLNAADNVAKWDGTNWSALGSNGAGNGSLNAYSWTLLVNGSDVYVGGTFTNVNNGGASLTAADYLAKWDALTGNWSALGSNGAGDGSIPNKSSPAVLALGMQGSNLFVGGGFYDINNGGTVLNQADFLAQWNGTGWSSLGTDANGALVNGWVGAQVYAVAVSGMNVYVGGNFTNVSNHGVNLPEADFLAKWDGADWSALGSNGAGDGSLNSYVNALAVDGSGNLYAGGWFQNVNNNGAVLNAADRVAKWDALTGNWSALGSDGAGNGSLNNVAYALAMDGSGNLYAGGNFTNVNNGGAAIPEADYLAKWDGANWSALGSNGASDGALNAWVSAIAVSGSNIYAGGGFTDAAGLNAADYIARWDGSNWSALGNNGGAGDGSLNDGVVTIAVSGSNVYAGGAFTDVNNGGTVLTAADRIAKWDALTGNWSALGGDGTFCIPCGYSVRAILVVGSDVYAGGNFADAAGLTAADKVAKWDGTNWSALGSDGAGDGSIKSGSGNGVYAFARSGTDLLVGGQFSNVNNNGTVVKEADYLAAYGLDSDAPTVTSIVRANANPTNAASVNFTVTFSESVTGVGTGDFSLTTTGVAGASVSGVSGSGATYTVSVNTGTRNGTIRLNVPATASITDLLGNPLSGLPYTGGQTYTVVRNTLTVRSNGTQDGWILESTETSNAGGTMNNAAATFVLGDNAADKQYRAILSFNTASLPDNAVITKVTLKIKQYGAPTGTNPFTTHGVLYVDIRNGAFGGNGALQNLDFQATASKTAAGTIPNTPVSGWYSRVWTSGIFTYVSKTGVTQFRLRFQKDDNDDLGADYLAFLSGNAGTASVRPTLIIEYYVP